MQRQRQKCTSHSAGPRPLQGETDCHCFYKTSTLGNIPELSKSPLPGLPHQTVRTQVPLTAGCSSPGMRLSPLRPRPLGSNPSTVTTTPEGTLGDPSTGSLWKH